MGYRRMCGALAFTCAASLAIAGCHTAEPTAATDGGARPATSSLCEAPHLPTRLRRLSRFEYDNTVRDLLHVPSSWGATLPPDDVVGGFDDNAAALHVGPLLASRLLAAAEGAAAEAMQNLPSLVPCSDESDACAEQLAITLGRRAFRRPLTVEERQRYLSLHRAVAPLDGFREGARTLIAALLQSPHFLYRTELGEPGHAPGDTTKLTDHEIASQLSYLFWASMPDEELLAAADAGAMHTPEQIASAARRLLASPRSSPMLAHFVSAWLELDGVLTTPKLGAAGDALTPPLRKAMLDEAVATFERAVRSGERLPSLFTSSESIAGDELARFYGVAGEPIERLAGGIGRWEVGTAQRGGLLATGAVLAAHAGAESASPVERGKLVRERLLCQALPPPPVGVVITLPPAIPGQSNRERFTRHTGDPDCAGCHRLMDPIGFGFERFDAAGRYFERDGAGVIDDAGEIMESPSSDGKFHGVRELQSHLAQSADVADCFATQWVHAGYGVGAGDDVKCLVKAAQEALRAGDLRVGDLLVALAQSIEFRQRVVR